VTVGQEATLSDVQPALARSWKGAADRCRPLLGLIVIAALLPLRANWGVDLVLVALSFTVPGILLLRALQIPSATVRRFPVYVPAAAILVMLAAGLGCDLIAPHLGVPHPLHGPALAEATLALSFLLWLAGQSAGDCARLPWAEWARQPILLAPLLLVALSALGALALSNGHGATIARVSIFVDLVAFLGCLLAAGRLSRRQVVAILFCCALAVEWSWSLRGQDIIGFDISTEYYIAHHTQSVGIWHPLHRNDAYGAMLSLGILPSLLTSLTGVSILIAFKVLYPAFAALLPVAIFLLADRVMTRRFAVGAAGLLLSQSYFFQLMPELARQEVALVFFAAMLAALLESGLRRSRECTLAALFAVGMVVSHYSSTYLAIPLIVIACIARLVVGRRRGIPVVSASWLAAACVLIGGSALWYGPITHSTSNVSMFFTTINSQGLGLLPKHGGLLDSYLKGNNVNTPSLARFQHLAIQQYHKSASYIRPLAAARQARYALQPAAASVPPHRVPALSSLVSLFVTVFNELLLLLIILGTFAMSLRRRWSPVVAEIGVLGFGALAFLLFIRFSATAAAEYNQTRALAQSLLILALPAAFIAERLAGVISQRLRRLVWPALALALALMFAQQSGAVAVVLGGGTSLNLSSGGEDYQRYYETPAELAGAQYAQKAAYRSILYADRYGQLRIFAVSGRAVLTSVTPRTLDRYAWVYGTRTNVQLGSARAQVYNSYGIYRWPAGFLNRYYETVYDNGDSKVYHGQ
jgi:uncharacterized membrane protein